MTAMPHLPAIDWDHADQMQHADLDGGGDVWFQYDAAGNRVRKVQVNSAGSAANERVYLGGVEVYRQRAVASGVLGAVNDERETLHIADDAGRVVMVETLTIDGGTPVSSPANVARYQYGNHLGTVALELDESAAIISYEEFHPYGTSAYRAVDSTIDVSAKRYRYAGLERDEETGLDHMGARYYAAWLGRWTAADPIGLGGGINLYEYAASDPIVMSDPSGTAPSSATAANTEDAQQQQTETAQAAPETETPTGLTVEVKVREGETRQVVLERALLQEFGEHGLSAIDAAALSVDSKLQDPTKDPYDRLSASEAHKVTLTEDVVATVLQHIDKKATATPEDRTFVGVAKGPRTELTDSLENVARGLELADYALTAASVLSVARVGLLSVLESRAARLQSAATEATEEGGERLATKSAANGGRGDQTEFARSSEEAVAVETGVERNPLHGGETIPGSGPGGKRVLDFRMTGEKGSFVRRGSIIEVKGSQIQGAAFGRLSRRSRAQIRDAVAFARELRASHPDFANVAVEVFTDVAPPTRGKFARLVEEGILIFRPIRR